MSVYESLWWPIWNTTQTWGRWVWGKKWTDLSMQELVWCRGLQELISTNYHFFSLPPSPKMGTNMVCHPWKPGRCPQRSALRKSKSSAVPSAPLPAPWHRSAPLPAPPTAPWQKPAALPAPPKTQWPGVTTTPPLATCRGWGEGQCF